MDFKLVYPILAIVNRLCVNCVLSVNLKVNKYNTIQYTYNCKWDIISYGNELNITGNTNVYPCKSST